MVRLPKDLLMTLRTRRSVKRLTVDPDTQHGVLMLLEQRVPQARLAEFFGFDRQHFDTLVISARNGRTERVSTHRGPKERAETIYDLRKREYAARRRARDKAALQ